MDYPNRPRKSFDNLQDISIKGDVYSMKKLGHSTASLRRIGSTNSLTEKRPGDYFMNKMAIQDGSSGPGSLITNSCSSVYKGRPRSGDSVISIPSTLSDENSQFDHPENISSISSSSIMSPDDSPQTNRYGFGLSDPITESQQDQIDDNNVIPEDEQQHQISNFSILEENPSFSSSMSTITSRKHSASSLSYSRANLSQSKHNLSMRSTSAPVPPSRPLKSCSTSTLPLNRQKSKYLNAQQVKERQQLRKKLYEENENDNDILSNDLDLVFNVPMIRSQSELYLKSKSSHLNLMSGSDCAKPFPLPGKLVTHFENSGESIYDNEDRDISQSISQFYSEQSDSISKLVKENRTQEMLYKLPSYIKSQSSIDDVSLMSPEKLTVLDQTRPINLPPKCKTDASKHNKEFKKCVDAYEAQNNEMKKRNSNYMTQYYKQWQSLYESTSNAKEFGKKLYNSKNSIRGLNWKSNCPGEFNYEILLNFLKWASSSVTEENILSKYEMLQEKSKNLSSSIRAKKDAEFTSIIEDVCSKPFFSSIIKYYNESQLIKFELDEFKKSFRNLLYYQSMNVDGLQKHEEMFLIPTLLLLFHDKPTEKLFLLIELMNVNVFNKGLLRDLNYTLRGWINSKKLKKAYGESYCEEFKGLDSTRVWSILLQLSDTLPLSLSAPSTPIHHQFARFSIQSDDNKSEPIIPPSSATLEILNKLIQSLVIYVNSSSPKKFQAKVIQSMLLVIFKYYHFGWTDHNELINNNIAIKLNKSGDCLENFISFLDKWNECILEV